MIQTPTANETVLSLLSKILLNQTLTEVPGANPNEILLLRRILTNQAAAIAAAGGAAFDLSDDDPLPLGVAGPGTSEQASRSDHVHPTFAGVYAKRDTNQSIPNSTTTPIAFETATWDDAGFWNAGAPTLLTIPPGQGGRYVMVATAAFANNVTGSRTFAIRHDGVSNRGIETVEVVGNANIRRMISALYELDDGDTIELTQTQNSGGPLDAVPLLALSIQRVA